MWENGLQSTVRLSTEEAKIESLLIAATMLFEKKEKALSVVQNFLEYVEVIPDMPEKEKLFVQRVAAGYREYRARLQHIQAHTKGLRDHAVLRKIGIPVTKEVAIFGNEIPLAVLSLCNLQNPSWLVAYENGLTPEEKKAIQLKNLDSMDVGHFVGDYTYEENIPCHFFYALCKAMTEKTEEIHSLGTLVRETYHMLVPTLESLRKQGIPAWAELNFGDQEKIEKLIKRALRLTEIIQETVL